LRWSNWESRATERGISKGGEPSRPTFSRTGPSIGTITLVASRTFSPIFAAVGRAMLFPMKLRLPMVIGNMRNELLEKSAFMIDTPSESMVPLPTVVSRAESWRISVPKLEPVCSTCGR
jgi:hypothetical protein